MKRLLQWFAERLQEPSTSHGIALLIIANGKNIPPAVLDAMNYWLPVIGTALIFFEQKNKPNE